MSRFWESSDYLSLERKKIGTLFVRKGGLKFKEVLGKKYTAYVDVELMYGGLDKSMLYPLAHFVLEEITSRQMSFNFIVCRGYCGDLMAMHIKFMLHSYKKDIPLFRQRNDEHGSKRRRFDLGEKGKQVSPQDRAFVFVDVVKSGGTLQDIILREEKKGLQVSHAGCLLDYEDPATKLFLDQRGIVLYRGISIKDVLVSARAFFDGTVVEFCSEFVDEPDVWESIPGEEVLPRGW